MVRANGGFRTRLNHDCHDVGMIAMISPLLWIQACAGMTYSALGMTVWGIPLAPLRSAKGGDSSLRFGMTAGIPRSHRFACSRPLTQAKGAYVTSGFRLSSE